MPAILAFIKKLSVARVSNTLSPATPNSLIKLIYINKNDKTPDFPTKYINSCDI
jgi:hypothetical protein